VQRQGVGGMLQRQVEASARAGGGRRLVLETSGRADYDAARRFYERVGYVQTGFIADFYRPGDDCVIYVKTLD
jgi:ribosomal protein S18 acetylase RimI-like enzyme